MFYAPPAQGIRTSSWVSSMGKETQVAGQSSVASSAALATDVAYIVRIALPSATTIRRFYWANGATAATNTVQMGIYNDDLSTFLLGTATTALGTSALQFDNVADTAIGAGRYWMALVVNGTTTTLQRMSFTGLRIGSIYTMAAARPLPATLVPATGTGILPLFGFTSVA